MTQQIVNIGSAANAKNGDPLRTAFSKINANFTELYAGAGGSGTALPSQTGHANQYLKTDGAGNLSWATVADDDSNYVTNSSLTSTLASYVTSSSLTTTLNSYALTSTIPTALSELTNDTDFLTPVTPPSSLTGAEGDLAGTVAFNSSYIYYCTADYVAAGEGGATVTLVPDELGQNVNTLTIAKSAPPNTGWATPQVGWTLTVDSTTVTIEEITGDVTNLYIVVSGLVTLPPTGNITFAEPGEVQPNIWVRQGWGVTNLNILDGGNSTTTF